MVRDRASAACLTRAPVGRARRTLIARRRLLLVDRSGVRATVADDVSVPLTGNLQPLAHVTAVWGVRRGRRLHQRSVPVPASDPPLLGGELPRGVPQEPETSSQD